IHYFKASSYKTRLRIFNILTDHELNVNEIVEVMAMGQSRISRHLKILTESGLLALRQDGLWSFYTAKNDDITKQFAVSIKQSSKSDNELSEDLIRTKQVLKDRQSKTKRFFNQIAGDWDRLKKDILGGIDLTDLILNKVPSCKVTADLGCGTGELLSPLKEKADVVIGVDSSPKMLDVARKRLKGIQEGIELRLGEMEHLPLRDGELDLAVVNMVLHHVPAPAIGIEEVHRVLKSSGIFILVDFDTHSNEALRKIYGDRWLGFKKREMQRWLTTAGFKTIESAQIKLQKKLKLHMIVSQKIE
ncbi:MAG: metalloregulator ArsR/SmtB family transcription factor, partial [Deltaproteobacteria bacterium]|nr:metalloregulator ArsR/SmtB family transcription factor [Deltaproteobacteria bacterium]